MTPVIFTKKFQAVLQSKVYKLGTGNSLCWCAAIFSIYGHSPRNSTRNVFICFIYKKTKSL